LWGGVVDISHMQNSYWQMPYCVAVFISGAIQTWSTIIDMKCNTKELIEKKLKSFKERIKLKKHSIGFMFVCTARGSTMHKKQNVESTIFKTLFPNVPLVGCFGDGEFGKNTMDFDNTKEGELLMIFFNFVFQTVDFTSRRIHKCCFLFQNLL
jgi:F-box protein 22